MAKQGRIECFNGCVDVLNPFCGWWFKVGPCMHPVMQRKCLDTSKYSPGLADAQQPVMHAASYCFSRPVYVRLPCDVSAISCLPLLGQTPSWKTGAGKQQWTWLW